MKNDKKRIKINIPYLYIGDLLEGSLEQVSKNIKSIPEKLKLEYKKHKEIYKTSPLLMYDELFITKNYYDNDTEYELVGYKWETDDEYKQRIDKIKEDKEKKEAISLKRRKTIKEKELKLLDTLMKKYGKK